MAFFGVNSGRGWSVKVGHEHREWRVGEENDVVVIRQSLSSALGWMGTGANALSVAFVLFVGIEYYNGRMSIVWGLIFLSAFAMAYVQAIRAWIRSAVVSDTEVVIDRPFSRTILPFHSIEWVTYLPNGIAIRVRGKTLQFVDAEDETTRRPLSMTLIDRWTRVEPRLCPRVLIAGTWETATVRGSVHDQRLIVYGLAAVWLGWIAIDFGVFGGGDTFTTIVAPLLVLFLIRSATLSRGTAGRAQMGELSVNDKELCLRYLETGVQYRIDKSNLRAISTHEGYILIEFLDGKEIYFSLERMPAWQVAECLQHVVA